VFYMSANLVHFCCQVKGNYVGSIVDFTYHVIIKESMGAYDLSVVAPNRKPF
jgi:hypothetical protein